MKTITINQLTLFLEWKLKTTRIDSNINLRSIDNDLVCQYAREVLGLTGVTSSWEHLIVGVPIARIDPKYKLLCDESSTFRLSEIIEKLLTLQTIQPRIQP